MVSYKSKMIFGLIGLLLSVILSVSANAAENRFFLKTPTSNKTTAGELTKAKKPGWECIAVKQGAKGNANVAKGAKSSWFSDVPVSTEDDAVDEKLANGKKAVRCTFKSYNKKDKKMKNAEIDDAADDEV